MSIRAFAAGATLIATASAASAATSTANMNVNITITAGCTVSVSNINFGSIAATAMTTAQTSTPAMGGLFSYTCSQGSTAPVLTAGQGANFSTTNRMKGATTAAFLPYTLSLPTLSSTVTGAAQSGQITATIPAQATLPPADTYSDTVVLTLTY